MLKHLYNLFIDIDAVSIEVNPVIITHGGILFASHSKIKIDQDSLFR